MIDTQKIKQLANRYYPEIVSWRRHIHQNPELSFQEFKTADYIEKTLTKIGLTSVRRIGKTGVVALLGKEGGAVHALRADIDALPITETNECDYKSSVDGVMHACGHDVHTACLLGAIRILKENENALNGQVKCIFQPGEEKLPGGASILIKEGVLESPAPSSIVGQHVHPPLAVGKLGFRSGKYMASADEIYLTVIGKGGHAALPDNTIDPLLVTSHIITALQSVVSRNADPKMPSVLSFGKVYSDGGATNVIPDRIHLEGTFRTFDESWRRQAHTLITRIVEHTCKAFGATCELDIRVGYPSLFNDPKETAMTQELAVSYLGKENVVDLPLRTSAEDFAFYSQKIPACFYRLGTGNEERNITSPVHTSSFDIDEKALEIGAGFMAYLALSRLQ